VPVYTVVRSQHVRTFRASRWDQIVWNLYRITGWDWDECEAIAAQIERGYVYRDHDEPVAILPGRWDEIG
jgi:hypothetical protein